MKVTMKRWIAPVATLFFTLCTLPAFAADATGRWTGKAPGPDDKVVTLIFDFKQEGTRLTGTLTIKDDSDKILDSTDINNGKVDGDSIFLVTVQSDDAEAILEGTIHGDDITLTVKSGPDLSELSELKLKRSK